ncbi:hypothetical protein PG994_000840 [Apiospora phragmitis]|uniref:Fucose-specific lectin n=1 Tax=Apiospora phragmitis TaxID=2905665 RepID=A0ABR1X7B3_9PEZI
MASVFRNPAVLFSSILHSILQLCLRHAQASQIAAFTNGGFKVPQVVMYDGASNSILYSLCNSQKTPVFPGDESTAFELQPQFPPYPGTHVSLVGYTDNEGIKTNIFYQTKDGHIVEALFTCNKSGHYEPVTGGPAYKLTDAPGIEKPKTPTDLTALLFGDDGGMQLYYKIEANSSVYSIKYKKKEKAFWVNAGPAEPWSSVGSIAAGFAVADQITVITPTSDGLGNEQDMFISTSLPDEEGIWQIDGAPVPLQAWNWSTSDIKDIPVILSNMTDADNIHVELDTADPTWSFEALDPLTAPLGLTFGSSNTMSIFYVGKDRLLRQVRCAIGVDKKNTYKWSNVTRPDAKAWPSPDETNAHFGTAYDAQADRIWVYYMSNRTMTQLYQHSTGHWDDAVALPQTQPHNHSRRNRAAENAALNDAHSAAIAPPSHPGSPAPRYTSGYWQPPPPGQQQHDGPWPQQQYYQPGVPYSDQNGFIKPRRDAAAPFAPAAGPAGVRDEQQPGACAAPGDVRRGH